MGQADVAALLDYNNEFKDEDRTPELKEKLSFSPIKRSILRQIVHRNRPHREHLGFEAKEARREDDVGSEVDSAFFMSEEEAEKMKLEGTVRAQIGGQLTQRMRSAMKAHCVHTHRPHLRHRPESMQSTVPSPADSVDSLAGPQLSRQDSHLSLATQDTQLGNDAAAAMGLDDEDAYLDEHSDRRSRIRKSKTLRTRQALQRRFLQKLAYSQRADLSAEERDAALVDALATTHIGFSEQERLQETEEIWENQRGVVLFGKVRFSAHTRLWGDPPPWTQGDHKPSPYTKGSYPLPDPRWEWSTSWLIDMRLPCDENGWSYSWRYSMHGWHAYPSWRNSFVRRRRWVRERRLAGILSSAAAQNPEPPFAGQPVERTHQGDLTSAAGAHQTPRRVTAGPAPLNMDLLSPLPIEAALDILRWENKVPTEWPFASLERVRNEAIEEAQSSSLQVTGEQRHRWRSAVVECSFRRVERILGPCPLDRERLEIWHRWLRNTSDGKKRDLRDMWLVLEERADDVLAMFEYQEARVKFLHELLDKLASEDTLKATQVADSLHPEDAENDISPRVRFADHLQGLLALWTKKFSLAPELAFAPVSTPTLLAEAPEAKPPPTPFFDAPSSRPTPFFDVPETPFA